MATSAILYIIPVADARTVPGTFHPFRPSTAYPPYMLPILYPLRVHPHHQPRKICRTPEKKINIELMAW